MWFDTVMRVTSQIWLLGIFMFATSQAFAQTSISNTINIQTNTGGNTITNRESASINTGDSSVSIEVSNQSESSQTKETKVSNQTQVNISTTGQGDNTVAVSVGKQSYRLIQTEGLTKLETTDSNGQTQVRQVNEDEELEINLGDQSRLKITNRSTGLELEHNQTKVATNLPLEIDQANQTITVRINENQIEVTKWPEEFTKQLTSLPGLTEFERIELIEDGQGLLTYRTKAQRQVKVLGILPVKLAVEISSPAHQSGSDLDVQHLDTWSKIVALFSW